MPGRPAKGASPAEMWRSFAGAYNSFFVAGCPLTEFALNGAVVRLGGAVLSTNYIRTCMTFAVASGAASYERDEGGPTRRWIPRYPITCATKREFEERALKGKRFTTVDVIAWRRSRERELEASRAEAEERLHPRQASLPL